MHNIQNFVQLIAANLGLYIREQDYVTLAQKLKSRMKALRMADSEQYYQHLKNQENASKASFENLGSQNGSVLGNGKVESANEWKELAQVLTTGESYFFRDRGQFSLLRHQLLPSLIEQRRRAKSIEGSAKPTLRIWSAGCSTGEEAHSLAILLYELIPNCQDWNISIIGTDINFEALEKARKGIYNSWSFRIMEKSVQERYFYPKKSDWELDPKIRKMVKFYPANLIKDQYPNYTSDLYNIDLIICRNVFIYFDSATIAGVLEKFYQTLRPGGFLLAGHAELYGQNLSQWQTKIFPESMVYQRPSQANHSSHLQGQTALEGSAGLPGLPQPGLSYGQLSPLPTPPVNLPLRYPTEPLRNPNPPVVPAPTPPTAVMPLPQEPGLQSPVLHSHVLREAELRFQQGAYAIAIQAAQEVLQKHPNLFDAYYLLAQSAANLGEYAQAERACHQAIAINPTAVSPYYLLAHLAEEQGQAEQAKNLLKKIIYLSPAAITAYLELSLLYKKEGDRVRAKKMQITALDLLKDLDPAAPVDTLSHATAGELMQQVKNQLDL